MRTEGTLEQEEQTVCDTETRSSLRTTLVVPILMALCCQPPTPQPPIADAGPDASVFVGETVVLDANGSIEPTGGPLDFQWVQSEGPDVIIANTDEAVASFVPTQEGDYRFRVTVTNSAGLSSSDDVGVRVTSREGGTVYTVLDPRFSYVMDRHTGETRVGTLGVINKQAEDSLAEVTPIFRGEGRDLLGALRFEYEFRDSDSEEFVGPFFPVGRIGIDTVNPDGTPGATLDLHNDSTCDFTDLMHNAYDDGISVEAIRLVLRPDGHDQTLTIRAELEDSNADKAFIRFPLACSLTQPVTQDLEISDFEGSIDLTAIKLISLVIEERHVADNVMNPPDGAFEIEFVGLIDRDGPSLDAAHIASLPDYEMIEAIARRDFETLLRLVDSCTGASLDRTLFRDLIHWGATGWLLGSLPGAVERGWITADDARDIALRILRFVDQDSLWGDDPAGKIGNSRGLMYRFGGIDPAGLCGPLTGTRKIDFDDVNAVEASIIDTALFQWGAIVCADYFSSDDARDQEIGDRVRHILNRTRWDELVDSQTGQLVLGWKPELDDKPPGLFTVPAPWGGYFSSRNDGTVLTIDFPTDEGALAAILAVGSEEHPVGPEVWYSMQRCERDGVVVTWPGAWFLYTFWTAVYADPTLGLDRGEDFGTRSIDWRANAINVFLRYQDLSPEGEIVLPDAVELPDTTYQAQGHPEIACDPAAKFTDTRSPYSLQLAIGLGDPPAELAIRELRRILTEHPELWDPIFGFLDSIHPNLADEQIRSQLEDAGALRTQGQWVQQQVWPLNKGAALLAQLNYLDDGIIWRTANSHPVIKRGIDRIYEGTPVAPERIELEGEDATGPGRTRQRDAASGQLAALLMDGESLDFSFDLPAAARYQLSVQTSNDNFGPLETVKIMLDGVPVGQFAAPDTGDWGQGWNVFESTVVGEIELAAGTHSLAMSVHGGDGFGVEVDVVTLDRRDP